MAETPLVMKVHGAEELIRRDQVTPMLRLKVETDTESGPLTLWLSMDAAHQLAAHLEHILSGKKPQ